MQIGRSDLSGPASGAAKAFGVVTGLLADVRAALSELCARLHDLDVVLAGQRNNGNLLDTVEVSARTVQKAVVDASSRASPKRISAAVTLAHSCLDEIASSTREIDAVVALTNVTARSLGMTSFDDYVQSLRRLVGLMRGDTAQFSAAVTALQFRREKAVLLFDQASSDLDQVINLLEKVAQERAETEQLLLQSLDDVGALALRLPSDTAAEIEILLQAMQFADALSQRLDHVGMVLAYREAEPADTGPLARALLEALVAETTAIAESVTNSLARINRQAENVGRIMGRDAESPASRALHLGRVILSQIADHTGSVLAAIEGAEGESSGLRLAAEDASERFASVMSATDAMKIYAINAALLARRGTGQQGAMNVLSDEVQRKAAQCARVVTSCNSAIRQLALPEDLAALSGVAPVAQAFRQSVGHTAAAVEQASIASSHLEQMRSATIVAMERLAQTTQVAGEAIRAINGAADDLTNLARTLPSGIRADANPLLELIEIYSMESERTVHRRLFGLQQHEAERPQSPATDDDLLASIMF